MISLQGLFLQLQRPVQNAGGGRENVREHATVGLARETACLAFISVTLSDSDGKRDSKSFKI